LVEAVHLVQKLTQQHIFADDYAHIYLYTQYSFLIITTLRVVVTVFFSSFTRLRLESGHLFDSQAALLKIGQIPQNKFKSRCFQLRQEMTTATTRKDDIGLVPFKDVCTLLHRIKTYHRKEGGKAKKHIAREYLDKFFENHYPRFFNGGERKDAFRLYRLLAPQVV